MSSSAMGPREPQPGREAARRAAASARRVGFLFGAAFGIIGLLLLAVGVATCVASGEGLVDSGGVVSLALGGAVLAAGVVVSLRARARGERAAWLRTSGLSLTARVVDAQRTGTSVNEVPVYRFVLQVAGPRGPYRATFDRLAPEHEVAKVMGQEVRVRAHPDRLDEVILED